MSYSHHERCPECAKLGRDRAGNNLARYRDGSGYCFSCGYREAGPHVYRPQEVEMGSGVHKPTDLCGDIQEPNWSWLKKYLTEEEIKANFTYSKSLRRHVFSSGEYWEGRGVLLGQRKVISHGDKPFVLFGSSGPIVVVEDVVSAIKVGRVATGLPLFGNSLPPEWMARIARLRPESVRIWLDSNMVQKARKTAIKMNKIYPCRTIETELDPKCYSTEEIMEYLK